MKAGKCKTTERNSQELDDRVTDRKRNMNSDERREIRMKKSDKRGTTTRISLGTGIVFNLQRCQKE